MDLRWRTLQRMKLLDDGLGSRKSTSCRGVKQEIQGQDAGRGGRTAGRAGEFKREGGRKEGEGGSLPLRMAVH